MFDNLTDTLGNVFSRLKGKGYLSEEDVSAAMREVRIALLEADVSLPVVKEVIKNIKEKAVGEEIIKNVNPAQQVIKIVSDELETMLGGDTSELNLAASPPVVILMAGLQGSGKTTTAGKIANWLKTKEQKNVLMASLDVYRPAAQKQLATLGKQVQIDTLEIIEGQQPEAITKRAMKEAKLGGYDVLILDTAGRTHVDTALMDELVAVAKLSDPAEVLLVADSLTGQDAVNVAGSFQTALEPTGTGISGIVLTRVDGDARGGAALSMKTVTGVPIKFLGVGEKISDIEYFHPGRVAQRILGMGDIVSLVEKAAEEVDEKEAKRMEKRLKKGQFDFNDLFKQLDQIKKMGGMGGMMGLMPGLSKFKDKIAESGVNDGMVLRQQAIIQSMTTKERMHPKLMNASRKKRIAAGAGVTVQEVNRLLKQFKQMQTMMKKMKNMKKSDMMKMAGQLKNMDVSKLQ